MNPWPICSGLGFILQIHRLDPRTKIFALLLLFGLGLTFNHPFYLVAILAGVLAIVWISGSLANVWKLRYMLLILMLFSTALWPFFTSGPSEIFHWWRIHVCLESLLYGAAMGFRTAIFLIVA